MFFFVDAAIKMLSLLYITGSGSLPRFSPRFIKQIKYFIDNNIVQHVCMVFHIQQSCSLDQYYEDAKKHGCFTRSIFVDMKSPYVVQSIKDMIEDLELGTFDGVFSPHETTQYLTAQVREALQICGNRARCYEIAQDKYLTKQILSDVGLLDRSKLKYASIHSTTDLPHVIKNVGFPMILKPSTGFGSMGVYKV